LWEAAWVRVLNTTDMAKLVAFKQAGMLGSTEGEEYEEVGSV